MSVSLTECNSTEFCFCVSYSRLGSISSRFVRPRSFAHTTAGSLVCPIVFLTNQRLACTNRAGKFLIGQFSLVNNKDGGYLRGKIFCCLLNPFLSCSRLEIWGIHQKALGNLFNGKMCSSAIKKVHLFCWLSDCLSYKDRDKLIFVNQLHSQFVLWLSLSFHFVDAKSTRILYISGK